jgi:hypothetical protein
MDDHTWKIMLYNNVVKKMILSTTPPDLDGLIMCWV